MRPVRSLRSALALSGALLGGAAGALLGTCGPFTDVAADSFCPFVLEVFYTGITTGTTPATYDPASGVNRLQMAAFLTRAVDGVLLRGGRRASLNQYWSGSVSLGTAAVGTKPVLPKSDGEDVWVPNQFSNTVSRVHGSTGRILETWTGAMSAVGAVAAMWNVFVTGSEDPGRLYRIDPSQPAGAVTVVASNLGASPLGIAFDGTRIWTANVSGKSVSLVTPGGTIPWTVTTVTTGFNEPIAFVYDGAHIWTTDGGARTLLKLDETGSVLQTVTVGFLPDVPAFDGANIWVPNTNSSTVSVVKASNGAVLATLTGNGLSNPVSAAFDGQRILVTSTSDSNVSLWKAADLTPIGNFPAAGAVGACSDGAGFFVTTNGGKLLRF